MRGQVKEWWGKLTDDELEQAAGNAEKIGLLYAAQSAGGNSSGSFYKER